MSKTRTLPTTELRNRKSENLDQLSSRKIVELINSEDKRVATAVGRESVKIARGIDLIVDRFRKGGRLFYVGAGTSGRLGVLDASECPPTFGVAASKVQGIIAGGRLALVRSIEGAEDNADDGAEAIDKKAVKAVDVVAGIAACGLTPFVGGALKRARQRGAKTLFITCSPENLGHIPADIIVNPVVGPEVVTGSTRMKAGTATKLVLNTLTTGAMIKIGKVYDNLMVDLKATNKKLQDRSLRIVNELTGLSRSRSGKLLEEAEGSVKAAIVMHYRGVDIRQAKKILAASDQSLRRAIEETL
jgi:N-acetylmuramic acid 6-phosphate etherase